MSTNYLPTAILMQKLPTLDSDIEREIMSAFDQLPPTCGEPIICCYVNATNKIQIARIANIPNWYFERVVFPGQRLIFQAVADGLLEIHTGMMASAILSDTIPCQQLQMEDSHPDIPDWLPLKSLETVN
jgi:hypothetical protein